MDAKDRSIPAYAGETVEAPDWDETPRVDPRVRGGDLGAKRPARRVAGRSPRTRGRHPTRRISGPSTGSIPAYAGETQKCNPHDRNQQVDPRVRGGDQLTDGAADLSMGRSPRTRGRRCGCGAESGCGGSIPAYAGETDLHYETIAASRVDPRVRGGDRLERIERYAATGRSPRTRGRQRVTYDLHYETRSIPAYAGETRRLCASSRYRKVDPRVRGGDALPPKLLSQLAGRSPRTRGRRPP